MPTPRRQMPRRIYPLRILGMGLGGMVVATVLWERQASPMAWTALLLATLGWPHVAYLLTRRAADPYAAEVRNLLIDSALVAALVPLMHFNLLPSVMLLTLTMVDKITTGIRGLWARALWVMLAAGAASTVVMGLHWAPETSMSVMVACLPVMSLHTLSVSVVSYQLIRQSARQNQMLDELRRVDALTGLFGRGHWQEQAEAALRRHHTTDEPACMLMLDIDHFKEINDAYGHTVGDEVIRALAHVVRATCAQATARGATAGTSSPSCCPACRPGTPWPLPSASASRPKACACAACPNCASPAASAWPRPTTATAACVRGSTRRMRRCTSPRTADAIRWRGAWNRRWCRRCSHQHCVQVQDSSLATAGFTGHCTCTVQPPPAPPSH